MQDPASFIKRPLCRSLPPSASDFNACFANFMKVGFTESEAQIKTIEKMMSNYDITFEEVMP